MYNIDEIDRRIIRELQIDGTRSTASLAETVGASQASCWRRIKAMEEVGILRGVVRLVDADAVGLGVNIFCDIRLHNHERETYRAFRQFVADKNEIVECFSMSGEWDYLLRIVTDTVRNYEKFINDELYVHPSVAHGASRFAMSPIKLTTALPL